MAFLGFLTSRAAARGHAALQPDGLAAAEQAAVAAVGVRAEAPAVTVGGGVALDPFVAKVCGKGVKLAQKMQVGPRIPAGLQLEKAEVGPTSRPTWRLSHFGSAVDDDVVPVDDVAAAVVVVERPVPAIHHCPGRNRRF